MSKFNFAGVSRRNGEFKVRFANDQMRIKVLAKTGSSDIDLIELREPMTKEEAVAYLIEIDFATRDGVTNAEVHAALLAAQEKREPKVPKVSKVKAAPTMESIKAKVKAVKQDAPELEDAPF
jgi:hypothetical protein